MSHFALCAVAFRILCVEDAGITYTFRNPQVFLSVGSMLDDRAGELAALAEIYCAVDYLAYHVDNGAEGGNIV